MPQTNDLAPLMTALLELERTVHPDLTVNRWRPRSRPELPGLWNWAPTSNPQEQRDQAQFRESFRISAYIGVAHSDADEEMEAVERYADAFRKVIDPAFNRNEPLDGACVKADRRDLAFVLDQFGDLNVLCVEFPLELLVHRMINPTS